MGGPNAGNPLAPRHTKLRYATRRKFVQNFNKDLNALRTHLFHAIRQHATRRGTTFARSNRPDFLVSVLSRASLLFSFSPAVEILILLIDLKLSKNSGIIMYHCRTFCKNFKFLMKRVNISF
jgi:hypothetical protein